MNEISINFENSWIAGDMGLGINNFCEGIQYQRRQSGSRKMICIGKEVMINKCSMGSKTEKWIKCHI